MDNRKVKTTPLILILIISMLILIILRYITSEMPLYFFFIFFPIIPLILLSVIIISIIFIKKNIHRIRIFAFVPFLIVLIGILILSFVPFTQIKLNLDFYFYINEREEVVELIKNLKLQANDNGYIVLPADYKKTSKKGEVQIEKNNGILKVVFYYSHSNFWTFANTGYVYIENDIELTGRHFDEIVDECNKITDNWYYCALFDNT
ncbi:MAG: hypothetical protein AB9835_05200 [Eubacteriales bacterium]